MDTFAPESNGWKFQRGYDVAPEFNVVEDPRELGNVKSYAVATRSLRTFLGATWRSDSRAAYEYWMSFFHRNVGPAARFLWALPELVPTPDAGPTLEAVVVGSQAQRTVFVKFAWRNTNGTTRASPASTLLIPANSLVKVTLPFYPPSVTQAVIYATQGSAGTEQEQVVLTNIRSWIQPNADLLLLTTSPQATNTATESAKCKLLDARRPFRIKRLTGITYEATTDLQEVY